MKFYFAPLEGITGQIYRNSFNKHFEGPDKYFMPFLHPKSYGHLSVREKEELAIENNKDIDVVPQILTNDAEDFLKIAEQLQKYHYQEVNFNLGCPSNSVVNKGRGSGFLAKPTQLDEFLTEVFAKSQMKISIKTRIGRDNPDEFARILEIFNKYPATELIVHPRIRTDFYANKPNWQAFGQAIKGSVASTCYNGDIFTKSDYLRLIKTFPTLTSVMLGRGLIGNPFLLEEIKDDNLVDSMAINERIADDVKRFWEFHDDVLVNYQRVMPLEMELTVVFKMKELWRYMLASFTDGEKYRQGINEAMSIISYLKVIEKMKSEYQ